MEFSILGPLEVHVDGRAVVLGGVKPRALVAMLVLHANEPVSAERLALALWGEEVPPGAVKTVQVYVSRLRKALGDPDVLETTPGGYRLRVRRGEVDAERFEDYVDEGRRALAAGKSEQAAAVLREALSLWRGPPLAELASLPFAPAEIARLEEQRLAALELRVEADLAAGRHAELVGELQRLTSVHPWRERLHAQLIVALYRAGRQADALEAYRDTRATLIDQLGVEPSPELRHLEQAILTHDPAVQAPERVPTSLPRTSRIPAPLTRTVGRDQDVREVVERFREDGVRFVTLTGPGGVGKTRLSVDVARVFEAELLHGAWFVALAGTAQPAHLASTVAQALAITPVSGETADDAIRRFLAPKEALIVLDNFEHLLSAAAVVTELLAACPTLKVLTTSREPLRVDGEHCFAVSPLAVPVDGRRAEVERTAASALFVERARRHDATFAVTEANAGAIAAICRRLDGLPLAIELAAARTPLLGPQELSGRLERSLDALGPAARDTPARQRTLRATIDWSYRLLTPEEARAFVRFAVFAGGATVEAAEHVTGANLDALEGLVDKHLLQGRHGGTGETRLIMLETVREYARERLDSSDEAVATHGRHCRHYLAFVESAEPALSTAAEAEWLPRLDAELDNVRAALDWSLRHGEAALGLRIAGLLSEFWDIRGLSDEGLEWLQRTLDAAGDDAPIHDRARAGRAQVQLLEEQGSTYEASALIEHARTRASEALALSRQTGDPSAIAGALLLLSHLEPAESFPQARQQALAEEALIHAREAGDERLIAEALKNRATALAPDHGTAELEQAVAALRKIGAARSLAALYNTSAYNAIRTGSHERAGPFLEHAVALARELGDQATLAAVCGNAGLAALFTGDHDAARTAFDEQLRICHELVIPWLASEGLAGLAAVATRHGDLDRAARLLGAATAHGPIGDADVIARLERDFFAHARECHGERRWREAHTPGTQLSFAEAIELALDTAQIR